MRRLALLAVAGALLAAPAAAQAPSASGDIRELASSLREFHPRPFHSVSRARFDAAVQRATTQAPSLSRNELVVELMRIAALIGDRNGHSGIFPGDPQHRTQLHLYPIRLYTFDDGTYVVDAVERDLVGTKLVSIADVPLATVFARVRPLVPHDNSTNLKGYMPHFTLTAEVLDGLHVGEGDGAKAFRFERSGTALERTLTPLAAPQYSRRFMDSGFHYPSILPRRAAPLYLANARKATWVTTLAGGRVVYAGYNTAQVDTMDFSNRIERAARPASVKGLVLDVRLNGGGDNNKYAPLLALLNEPAMKRKSSTSSSAARPSRRPRTSSPTSSSTRRRPSSASPRAAASSSTATTRSSCSCRSRGSTPTSRPSTRSGARPTTGASRSRPTFALPRSRPTTSRAATPRSRTC